MGDGSTILSVGIDVGTSTTQVVFSRLRMDNAAGYFSVPRVSIVDKEVVYKSDVYLTPLKTEVLIDADALRKIVAGEFDRAGYRPKDTTSGAVIITGESARKENSDAVLASLSDFAGDFVVSAAGPDMESVIAGKGSGAWQYSIDRHCRTVNLDIGGGTTNIVVFDEGQTVARGCLDIGGRLICVDRHKRITKISPAAAIMAKAAGVNIAVGQMTDESVLDAVVRKMAEALEVYLGLRNADNITAELLKQIKTPGSSDFPVPVNLDAICFSGGVADMIYHRNVDSWQYGDIGVLLGCAIRDSRLCSRIEMMDPGETIRATVVGAGTYTTTISGSTITYSDDIFPLKNIPVIKLDEQLQRECFEGKTGGIIDRIRWYQHQSGTEQFILAMNGLKNPNYEDIKRAAGAVCEIIDQTQPSGAPILLVIESDIAKAMGQLIKRVVRQRQVVAIDSIHVEDGEYIDMGKPLMNGMVIPVVVKTLIFG